LESTALAEPNRWYTVPLGEGASSADGSPYSLFYKRGTSDNVIVYFSGGGVVWDTAGALDPITLRSVIGVEPDGFFGAYFDSIPVYKPGSLGGLIEASNDENPFDDWSVIYIPYSTGDFHAGNATHDYVDARGRTHSIRHWGRRNVETALAWAREILASPDGTLLVAGESAGGFGSSFWLPEIASMTGKERIYHLIDSSYLLNSAWPSVASELWGVDWEREFGFPASADLIGASIRHNLETVVPATGKELVVLQSHTLRDNLLPVFQNRIEPLTPGLDTTAAVDAWSAAAVSAMRRLDAAYSNYYSFLTSDGMKDGMTPHTISAGDTFYELRAAGVTYSEWLSRSVIEDDPLTLE
jgi:hypothetical protein